MQTREMLNNKLDEAQRGLDQVTNGLAQVAAGIDQAQNRRVLAVGIFLARGIVTYVDLDTAAQGDVVILADVVLLVQIHARICLDQFANAVESRIRDRNQRRL